MGIDRSKIAGVVRNITVDYYGEQVKIEYRPDAWTPQNQEELMARRNGDGSATREAAQATKELVTGLAKALVRWDVLEDGEELKPTEDVLATFPNAFLAHLSDAINRDMYPNLRRAAS